MESLLGSILIRAQDVCNSLAGDESLHPRIREEYRQINRFINQVVDMIDFAEKLEKLYTSPNMQFVAVDGDSYRPISAVEALSKIEQIDLHKIFSNRFFEGRK